MSYIKSKENDMKTCSVGAVLFMGVSCQQRPTALTDAQKAEAVKNVAARQAEFVTLAVIEMLKHFLNF